MTRFSRPPFAPLARAAVALLPALTLSASACGGQHLPQPATGPHSLPVERWTELDAPPPPVQVEEVPPRPGDQYVWLDGQWIYQPLAKRWTWDQGRWCIPPANSLYYAPPELVRFRKVIGRVVRQNDQGQWEEVDSLDDRWRWVRGRFMAYGNDGAIHPVQKEPDCQQATGFETGH